MSDDLNDLGSEVIHSTDDGTFEVEVRDNEAGRLVVEFQRWNAHPSSESKQVIDKRIEVGVHDALDAAVALLERFAPHLLARDTFRTRT